MNLTYESIAHRIDHALLAPTLTEAEMLAGCQLAAVYEVASVCIKPYAIDLAVKTLRDSKVKVGTVIGFPHGGQATAIKVAETVEALRSGAAEIDMVVNIGEVISGRWRHVEDEIRQVVAVTREHGALLKVILETCYLTDDQKIKLCEICGETRVGYVKTSTGYGTGGATEANILLMRRSSPDHVKVKASGGIRDLKSAIRFAELGAERLGLSRTAEILDELSEQLGLPRRNVSRGTMTGSENY